TTKVQQHLVQPSHFSTATSPEVTASQHVRKSKSSAQPLLLSVSDVATLLGVCRQTVYNYMYHEGLPSISVGGIRRIHPDSLNHWILEREVSYGRQTTRA